MKSKFNLGDKVWFFSGGELLNGYVMRILKERDFIQYGITREIESSCREFDRNESRVFKDVWAALRYKIDYVDSEIQLTIKDLQSTLDQVRSIIEKNQTVLLPHPPKPPHHLDGDDCPVDGDDV